MNQRSFKRIPVSMEAELISSDSSFAAYIGNVSENGIYTIITPLMNTIDYSDESDLNINLHLPTGETLNLSCKKRWTHVISPHGKTIKIGMEVVNPPAKYKEFLRTLQ
jgi:hypothetical protein